MRRWHENIGRTSKLNAGVRLRRLNLFCHRTGTTPRGLAALGQGSPKAVEDLMHDHVTWLEGSGRAPTYAEDVIKCVKSWLDYNRVDVRRKIRFGNTAVATRIADERVPDQGQLGRMLAAADPRGRAVISLMAFSGVRPQVMGLADASDGLRLSDLPDLRVAGGDVSFARTPAMVTVRASLSKTRNKYVTFLSEEGCGHLLGYLRHRRAQGDPLQPDSPVIAASRGSRLSGWRRRSPTEQPFMVTQAITESVRPAIWAVTRVRPYALRAYFDSQLLIAESHGCMTHSYRQFFMGHKGDMEARYTTNRGRLTEQMSEDMRRSYASSEAFLSTGTAGDSQPARREALIGMWRRQAAAHGMDPDSVIVAGAHGGLPGHGTPTSSRPADPRGAEAGCLGGGLQHLDPDPVVVQLDPTSTVTATAGDRFDAAIADGDGELLARCAGGWDVVRELADGRFLMRRAAG